MTGMSYQTFHQYAIISNLQYKEELAQAPLVALFSIHGAEGDLNPHGKPHAPQTCVSTYSTTSALQSHYTQHIFIRQDGLPHLKPKETSISLLNPSYGYRKYVS